MLETKPLLSTGTRSGSSCRREARTRSLEVIAASCLARYARRSHRSTRWPDRVFGDNSTPTPTKKSVDKALARMLICHHVRTACTYKQASEDSPVDHRQHPQ